MRAIVIGAGTAGLGAVHTLRKAGTDVICLEATAAAGGRTSSRRKNGYILDIGAQFLFKQYFNTFRLCEELGLSSDLASIPFRVGFPDGSARKITPVVATINPRDIIRNWREFLAFRGIPFKATLQMLPILATVLQRKKDLVFTDFERMLDLDDESLADLTRRMGGTESLERLMQPLASCLTLGEPEDMGAGYGLALLWYSMHGIMALKHGIGSLFERLAQACEPAIRLNTPAQRIIIEHGTIKGVETAEGLMEADAVICTTTATTALKLMPDLPDTIAQALNKVTYSACCHVMFALYDRLLPPNWYAVAVPRQFGSPLAGFTDSSIKSPAYAPTGGGLIHAFTYSRHAHELNNLPDDRIKEILIGDIKRYWPRMPDQPFFTEIERIREAVCLSPPGMLKAIAHMRRYNARIVKGLYLAGDYMYMPSVEGALTSGLEAAKASLESAS